jgi:DeoR/GlpR family transcriptional regulator of sugar metabolism
MKNGGEVTRQQIQDKFGGSEKTAKRDLAALRDQLEFVRQPHPGFYRMAVQN